MNERPPHSRDEFIALLDQKLEQVLGCPAGWGGVDALEPLVLTLVMLRSRVCDAGADDRSVLRRYKRFLAERLGPGPADLRTRLGEDASEARVIEILREFVDEQYTEDPDLPAARLPEPPRHRKVPGGR